MSAAEKGHVLPRGKPQLSAVLLRKYLPSRETTWLIFIFMFHQTACSHIPPPPPLPKGFSLRLLFPALLASEWTPLSRNKTIKDTSELLRRGTSRPRRIYSRRDTGRLRFLVLSRVRGKCVECVTPLDSCQLATLRT